MSVDGVKGLRGRIMRTLPSLVSSIVRRPTSCPCLSPETSSSPWSSSRKNSDEPSCARADGRAGSEPFGEDLGGRGRVRGMIIARRGHCRLCRLKRVWSGRTDVSRGVKSISSFLSRPLLPSSQVTTAELEESESVGGKNPFFGSYAVLGPQSCAVIMAD